METNANFNRVLKPVIDVLVKNTSWQADFTMKHQFCWGVLSTCCSKIPIHEKDMTWVYYIPIIETLCEVFLCAVNKVQIKEFLAPIVPASMQNNEVLLRYVMLVLLV